MAGREIDGLRKEESILFCELTGQRVGLFFSSYRDINDVSVSLQTIWSTKYFEVVSFNVG